MKARQAAHIIEHGKELVELYREAETQHGLKFIFCSECGARVDLKEGLLDAKLIDFGALDDTEDGLNGALFDAENGD